MMHRRGRSTTATRHQRGIALILVVIALAVAAVLSLTFVSAQSTTIGVAENIDRLSRARAIAESAVGLAMADVNRGVDWRTKYTHGSYTAARAFGAGTYQVKFEDGWDTNGDGVVEGDGSLAGSGADLLDDFTLTARGTCEGVTHLATVRVDASELRGKVLLMVKDINYIEPLPAYLLPPRELTVARDVRLRTMLEGMGWVVTPILETAATSAILTAASQNDVVFVSGGTWHENVMSDLELTGKGAVSNEYGLMLDWGFMNDNPSDTLPPAARANLTVANASHEIMQGLSGTFAFVSPAQSMWLLNRTMASNATVLARVGTVPAVACFEQNMLDYQNRTVKGRRVILPWSMFAEPAQLTAQGRTLFSNALTWAAKPPSQLSDVGLGATGAITIGGASKINVVNSSTNKAVVATNRTTSPAIALAGASTITGDARVGVSGSTSAITTDGTSSISGTRSVLPSGKSLSIVPAVEPTGLPGTAQTWNNPTSLPPGIHRYTSVTMGSLAQLNITGTTGKTIIWCNGLFSMNGISEIKVGSGAELHIYADRFDIQNTSKINWTTPAEPKRAYLYQLGNNKDLLLANTAAVAAVISAANGNLRLENASQLVGTFEGKTVSISGASTFTHDASLPGVGVSAASGGASQPKYKYDVFWSD